MKLKLPQFHFTSLSAIFFALMISILISAGALYWSNLNVANTNSVIRYMNESLSRSKENIENQEQFKEIAEAHQNITLIMANATKTTQQILLTMNETERDIATLTNDIYIMQKSELESRKALGKFLAVVGANNNITIPEDLRKLLLIENSEPLQSAPNY